MIHFNEPALSSQAIDYVQGAYRNLHVSGDGKFTKLAQALLEEELGAAKVLLTTSCTHALELSALLLDLQPGDEVIVPSFTFVSSINAFVLRGAVPVFIDIRPDTLNLDEALLESCITSKTKAIVPVHYAGVACAMDQIMGIAAEKQIAVIEDNAHGLFGKYNGKSLGSFGALATQSFHETKNISCGEGGAIVINDALLIERAEILREKGTNRSHFFRGMVDKYTWVDVGSSYLPSDILAAILYAQLEERTLIQQMRKSIWQNYKTSLADWASQNNCVLPTVPPECDPAYHLFYLLLPNLETRQAFIAYLKKKEIHAVFHYLPLHLSPMGKKYGGKEGQYPVTESVSDRLVRLPFHNKLTPSQQDEVIEAVLKFQV